MKKLTLIFSLLITQISIGQDTIVSYLDSYKRKYVSKENAAFTKVMFPKESYWKVLTFKKLDTLLSEELFSDKNLTKKVGEQKYYYTNGKLKLLKTYDQNEKLEGNYVSFFDDGSKSMIGVYRDDKKEGLWNYYYSNGNKIARIIFNDDKVIRYNLWDENGIEKKEKLIFEQKPEYKGGKDALNNYIVRNLKKVFDYKGILGRVIVRFTVGADGKTKNVEVFPDNLPDDFKEIVKATILNMPAWSPGIQLNRKIDVKFSLPIKI